MNRTQGGQGYPPNQDYSHYYDPSTYWQNYGWSNYYDPSASGQTNYAQYNYMMPGQAAAATTEQTNAQYTSQYQYPPTPAAPPPPQQTTQPQPQIDPDLELVGKFLSSTYFRY